MDEVRLRSLGRKCDHNLQIVEEGERCNRHVIVRHDGEYRGTCFPAGTKVSTLKGLVNIESIKTGDVVYAYDFAKAKVETESQHKWVKAADLKQGMRLRLRSGKLGNVPSVAERDLKQPESTYNFEVATGHDYFTVIP